MKLGYDSFYKQFYHQPGMPSAFWPLGVLLFLIFTRARDSLKLARLLAHTANGDGVPQKF